MKQEYFVYNGQRYNKETIILIEQFCYYSCKLYKECATFLYYDTNENVYALKIGNKIKLYSEKEFKEIFCGVYRKNETKIIKECPKKEWSFFKELEIDGLFLSWAWYVFIMLIATIFNGNIFIWIFSSVVFFNYRNKKLKEAGYK